MTIATTIIDFLQQHRVPYSVVAHDHSGSSRQTVSSAHVPPERLAKAVIFHDRRGYLMAVVPGNRYVSVKTLSEKLGRELALAEERRIAPVFGDCDPGAIPPLGPAYGMETILDDSLVGQPEIYFESGDHEELIQVSGEDFLRLMSQARHGQFSH
jgi:Ala-tRNA(Pro) deacylase